jgi:hypothetical protein
MLRSQVADIVEDLAGLFSPLLRLLTHLHCQRESCGSPSHRAFIQDRDQHKDLRESALTKMIGISDLLRFLVRRETK